MGNDCMAQHQDTGAVRSGGITSGGDIDAAVLAATNFGATGLAQKLELSFKCKNLANMDTFSKSDPFVVLFKQQGNMWANLGQTEIIHDNLNPEFVQRIVTDFHFEQNDRYKVQVYDCDDEKSKNLSSHDFIGELEFSLHDVVTCRDQTLSKPLINANIKNPGTIEISADEQSATANSKILIFNPVWNTTKGSGLCFFLVYRETGPNKFTPIFKSEVKRSSGSKYEWNQVQIGQTDICKDNIESQIKIEIFRNETSGKHKLLGTVQHITLGQLNEGTREFAVNKTGGTFLMSNFRIEAKHSFLEYVFGGCEIDLTIAIDFTLSNGAPNDPSSLHFNDPMRNQYLQAIQSVGHILQYYNTDKQIQLYGFGGAVPPYSKRASHCFALNGDIFNPRVNGLEAVVTHYQNAIMKANLYGPTYFSEILQEVNNYASSEPINQNNQKFHIALIITDGIINDMDKTIDEIVRGSELPVGIIIVGVGDADFESMEVLDGDDEALYSKSYRKYAAADIVQFVPFNQYKNNPHLLAKETLMEIPTQLLNFFRRHNIQPHARTEQQRQMIQQQMSMRQNVSQQAGQIPMHFVNKREQFLAKCQEMGMDHYQIQDFLNNKGICEAQIGNVLDQLNNPNYVNVLKMMPFYQQMQYQPISTQGMNPMMGGMAQVMAQNVYSQMGVPYQGMPMQGQPMMGQPGMQNQPQGQPQGQVQYNYNYQQQ